MYTKLMTVIAVAAFVFVATPTAQADWDPGMDSKMHYPQLPDPNGWDCEFVSNTSKIGDDWQCTGTGPVSDIHIWLSWQKDNIDAGGLPGRIEEVGVEIYKNVEPDTLLPYSRPEVTPVWSRVFTETEVTRRPYGQGDQGFYAPQLGLQEHIAWERPDHQFYEQLNITGFDDPFIQEAGEIYWLVMWVAWDPATSGSQNPAGWKTSESPHFMDDAVWYNYLEPVPELRWNEIVDPVTFQSLDLAFVITPEPATLALLALGGSALIRRR